jgi:hypothetical protein
MPVLRLSGRRAAAPRWRWRAGCWPAARPRLVPRIPGARRTAGCNAFFPVSAACSGAPGTRGPDSSAARSRRCPAIGHGRARIRSASPSAPVPGGSGRGGEGRQPTRITDGLHRQVARLAEAAASTDGARSSGENRTPKVQTGGEFGPPFVSPASNSPRQSIGVAAFSASSWFRPGRAAPCFTSV